MSEHANELMTVVKESFLRLMFEFMGTTLATSLWLSVFASYDFIGFFVGYFVLLVFSARISGSHFNPAVTLAFMFRKETGGFSRVLGIAYIVFQFGGGIAGGFLAYTFFQAQPDMTVVSRTVTVTTDAGGYETKEQMLTI
jgi:glycerol uptake facilitator-like aquaporin